MFIPVHMTSISEKRKNILTKCSKTAAVLKVFSKEENEASIKNSKIRIFKNILNNFLHPLT